MNEPSTGHDLSRRAAIQHGLGVVAAVAWAPGLQRNSQTAAAAESTRLPWIDAHVHVWTPDVKTYPLAEGYQVRDMQPASFTPEQLMAHARPCDVGRVVLIQMSYYGHDNRYMLDVIQREPQVYRGVAIVDELHRPAERMRELARQGVRGFRIQPQMKSTGLWFDRPGMVEMWQCGADEGLALCHLIDANVLPSVAQACQRFPRTPVVIDHFARIGIDGQIRDTDLDQLCRLADHSQVSVKVSAFYALGAKRMPYHDLGPMIQRLLAVFGRERLMWASDCPYQVQGDHTYRASLDLIRSGLSFLTDQDREWLLSKTAAKVFFRE